MSSQSGTLKKSLESEAILRVIAELARTVEAVREGIECSSKRYDRLEAKFFDVRSDVSNMRADIREFGQVIRKRELV